MSVRFLNDNNFTVQDGQLILIDPQYHAPMNGICFVMFYMTSCPSCQQTMPQFDALTQQVHGISFGKVDVATSPRTHQISQQSSTPLQAVPTLMLFIDGYPHVYRGRLDMGSMQGFLNNTLRAPGNRQSFMPPQPSHIMPPGPVGGGMGGSGMGPPPQRRAPQRRAQAPPEPSGYAGPYPTYEQAYPGANYRDISRS